MTNNNASKTTLDQYSDASQNLLELPAEMRDHIYDYVFTTPSTNESIDIREPTPPEKAILTTCQQVYAEANIKYRFATRKYWQTNRFHLSIRKHDNPRGDAAAISRRSGSDSTL